MNRTLAVIMALLGLWLFLAPFLGPTIGLPLVPAPSGTMMNMGTHMSASHMVMINRAMVFFNFIPGLILLLVGMYYIFREQPNRAAL